MRHERINCWKDGEYAYAPACGFQPNLRTYLHEDDEVRPCVLVIPGGGYRFVSPSEGEIVALRFYEMGYQTFVGTYTVNLLDQEPLWMQPLRDLSRMVRLIRSGAEAFHLRQDQIFLCGFSAGAHLCGSLCVHWQDVTDPDPCLAEIPNRPDGAILSYPVITAGEFAHRDSFTALLGSQPDEDRLAYMSLETQVNPDTPPVFLWQTAEDETVPVENSYLMAQALRRNGIPFAHHVFPRGHHGLSLANEDWAERRYGVPYPMEPAECAAKALYSGQTEAGPAAWERLKWFCPQEGSEPVSFRPDHPVPDVAVWPDLADQWIRALFF